MGLISPLIWVISIFTQLIRPLITTHETPSSIRWDLLKGASVLTTNP